MKDWTRARIDDISLGLYDGPHATPSPADDGPIFLGIKNITDDGRLDFTDIRHISEEEYPEWTKRVVPQCGDIVFTYEATLNRYAIIPEGFKGCLGRRVALLRPDTNKVNTRFLHYFFFSRDWRKTIARNMLHGSTVNRIPLTDFPEFEVSLPPLPTQRRIAGILSAYDDLIENNARRIQLLEEMARAVYREWFVHYRFPGHEDVATRETDALGPVPEGWDVAKLSDVAKVNRANVRKDDAPEQIHYVTISCAEEGDISDIEIMPYSEAPSRAKRIVQHGDILWSKVRPNLKGYGLVLNPAPNTIASTGFAVITPDAAPYSYLYPALTTESFVDYLTNRTSGAAYPAVKIRDFKKADVLLPSENILQAFDERVSPFFELRQQLTAENINLRRTRDLLLPRLVSGEIDVGGEVPEQVLPHPST